jgi:hypothetical protein
MSDWPASKARRVLSALQRIGWRIVRTSGSHRTLRREGWPQWLTSGEDFLIAVSTLFSISMFLKPCHAAEVMTDRPVQEFGRKHHVRPVR